MSEPLPPEDRVLLPHEAVAAVLALPREQLGAGLAGQASEEVFATGVLLAEMLSGQASPVGASLSHPDALERRFQNLPEDWGRNLDEPLQAQISRALDPDPQQRFADAADFRAALAVWSGTAAGRTLETLLARMKRQGDFPALSDAMGRILKVASSDDDSLEDLAREILQDVALTQQLLRLVNSAHYAQVRGMVTTVSRAVGLVGFNGVRNLALSLRLLERMPNQAHATQLKAQFLRALMAGSLAYTLCVGATVREDAFLGALFQNLGRLLIGFYFPAEAAQIEQAVAEARDAYAEATAAIRLLGLSPEDIGTGVARSWGLPNDLLHCMRRPFGRPPPRRPAQLREYLRWLALAANDITTALVESAGAEPGPRLKAVSDRYARVLGLSADEFAAALLQAQERLAAMAQAMGLPLQQIETLTRPVPAAPEAEPAQASNRTPVTGLGTGSLTGPASAPAPLTPAPPPAQASGPVPVSSPPSRVSAPADAGERTQRLARQHEALKALLAPLRRPADEVLPLPEALRLCVAGLQKALQARRVVFCLRESGSTPPVLTARHGVGEGWPGLQSQFRVGLQAPDELLAAACRQGSQTVVQNAGDGELQGRLPQWLREQVRPGAFWLMPLMHREAVFALLYADVAEAGGLLMDPGSRELLRQLGEQLVLLFRQRQGRGESAP